ncbi:MAG TPA: patatin-like phospholipase family protein [Kofleriaceae bacterium]|nr:patatin-like phospholipase family protein [Kofleriaceae bacterium]
MPKTFVLTCDGGGIRGYITTSVLGRLVAHAGDFVPRVTLHAGTSTGSFIALALAAGVPLDEIANQYAQASARKIFTPNTNPFNLGAVEREALHVLALALGPVADFLFDHLEAVFQTQFTHDGISEIAHRLLGAKTLGELGHVLVNTLQLDDAGTWTPRMICNWGSTTYNAMSAAEAGLCSGAAPLYFPPFSPPSMASLGPCADGGLFANNPSLTAIAHALRQGVALDDLFVLSLDTGTTADGMSDAYIHKMGGPLRMGPLAWLRPAAVDDGDARTPKFPLLSALMDSTSEAITQQAQLLLGDRYCRTSVPLPQPVALDDTSDAAYATMNKAVDDWQGSPAFTRAVRWLEANVMR